MEALGRVFNTVAIGDDVYVSLRDAAGVSFLCYLSTGGDTYTLTEARDAAGTGAQVLATITRYWVGTGVNGQWTLKTQAAGSTAVAANTAAERGTVVEVEEAELSDGYRYVKLTSTGAGLVTPILHDLIVQRKPSNLASVVA